MSIKQWLYDHGIHFHWQNLNELPGDKLGPGWKHGRAWFRAADQDGKRSHWPGVGVAWNHGRLGLAAKLNLSRWDREATWHIALPGLSYFLTIDGIPPIVLNRLPWWHKRNSKYRGDHREIGVQVHSGSFWLHVWGDSQEWNHADPWWYSYSLDFADTLFGKSKYDRDVIEVREVKIPMPEGEYDATVQIELTTWKRPRWPWAPWSQTRTLAKVDIPKGIGFPGKGENSWDCGDDALYGISCQAKTVEEAIGQVVASALRSRQRYGGSHTFKPVETKLSNAVT